VDKIEIVNKGADKEDFDEIGVIMEIFRVKQRIREIINEK